MHERIHEIDRVWACAFYIYLFISAASIGIHACHAFMHLDRKAAYFHLKRAAAATIERVRARTQVAC